MLSSKFNWIKRVKDVEREYNATQFAIDYLKNIIQQDPNVLAREIKVKDFGKAAERLEGTYTIRLFAEFETCLRKLWEVSRSTKPGARTLLDSVGDKYGTPRDWIDNAHAVREYRNSLVHEKEDDAQPIALDLARRYLCCYLSRLPPYGKW